MEMGGSAGTWAAVPVILSSSARLPRASLSSSVATSALSVVLVVDAHDEAKTVGQAASVFLNDSSCAGSILEEVADLRQQMQAMKKQAVTVMDQSRKSSDREQDALRQAQEALELKESASASHAAQRENYMLDLMTDASQDMAGMLLFILLLPRYSSCPYLCYIVFSLRYL